MCYTLQLYLLLIDGFFLGMGAYYVMTGCTLKECLYYSNPGAKLERIINGTYAQFSMNDHTTCYTKIGTLNRIHINASYDNVFIEKNTGECFYDKDHVLTIKFIAGAILLVLGYLFSALTIYVYCFEHINKVGNSYDDNVIEIDTINETDVAVENV